MPADQFPRGARRAVADWLLGHPQAGNVDPWEDARGILEAVLPLIERDVQRQMARHLLMLGAVAPDLFGTFHLWQRCLRGAQRGKPLPPLVSPEDSAGEQLSEVTRG